jgi:23S rRNA pseudouridine2605 synthase
MSEIPGGPLDENGEVRLHKYLAQSGVASRRHCEEFMLAGLVEVDGAIVTRLGTKINPRTAVVRVDGKRLPPVSPHVYLALHKPRGVVTTMSDPQGRRTVAELVADRPERLFHVGRLDADTTGLLLMTNDGDFAHRVAHPSFAVVKTYVAEVVGEISRATVKKLLAGVNLEDGSVQVTRCKLIGGRPSGGRSIVELDLHEGRNHIVRRLLDEVGHPVKELARIQFGPVKLGQLGPGTLRNLTRQELGGLLDEAQL